MRFRVNADNGMCANVLALAFLSIGHFVQGQKRRLFLHQIGAFEGFEGHFLQPA